MPFVKTLAKFVGSVDVGKLASSSGTVIDILGLMSGGGGIAVSVGAGAVVGGVLGFAGGVAASQMMRRWSKDGGGEMPAHLSAELQSAPPEKVTKIFEVFADGVNQRATAALDDALADLMDSPDWDQDKARLDAAVTEWSRNRKEGAGSPLDHAETVQVLMSLIRNLREAKYRELFAEHHREVLSIDRPDWWRVEDVFIRLQAEPRELRGLTDLESDESGETVHKPEVLDFRGNTPVDIEDTLRKSGNLVILGEPGSGKSILLRFLAASCGESESNDALLPVRLRLRDHADSRKTLIEESAAKFAESDLQLKMPKNFFEHALKTGRCLVCLDALDEVPLGERRRIVKNVSQLAGNNSNNVSQLAGNNSNNRFIVTSRIAGYDELPLNPKTFTRYVVQPMDDDDKGIRAFIDRLSPDDPERAQSLWDVVDANPHIKSLVSNPLLMAMLNEVYQDGQEGLPLNRAKLYERAVDFLVKDKDDTGRKIDDDGHPRHNMLLTGIARSLHNENRETIDRDELEALAADLLLKYEGKAESPTRAEEDEAFETAEAFIERAERRTGLLVEQQPGSGEFGFIHATFREYLTARDIHARNRNYRRHREECWEEIKNHLTDARWREVILLLLASFEERYCTYLTEKILATGDKTVNPLRWRLPTHLQLAADALANQAPMSAELQQDVVGRLRSHRGRLGSPHVEEAVVRALRAIKHLPEIIVPVLTAIATDPAVGSPNRVSAARALADVGERDKAISVLTAIATDSAVGFWSPVPPARALADVGERDTAVRILTAIVTNPEDNISRRGYAARALADMGESDEAIPVLTATVTDPAVDSRDRVYAARALAAAGEKDTVVRILTAIVTNPEDNISDREYAARTLADMDERDRVIPILTAIVTDLAVDSHDRVAAAGVLARLRERDTAIPFLSAIVTDPAVDSRDRVYAARALADAGERDTAIPILVSILTDPDSRGSRLPAEVGLMALGKDGAVALATIAGNADIDEASRRRAINVLYRTARRPPWKDGRDEEAKIALAQLAQDTTVASETRGLAGWYLGQLGEAQAAITALTDVVNDPAALAMEKVRAAGAIQELGGSTEDPKAAMRSGIADHEIDLGDRIVMAWRLSNLGVMEDGIATLTAIANDETVDDINRVRAAWYLGELDASELARPVLNVLATVAEDETTEPFPRFQAGKMLADLGATETAAPALTSVAYNAGADAEHRIGAAKVLNNLGDKAAAKTALQTIADDETVSNANRGNARDALRKLNEQ